MTDRGHTDPAAVYVDRLAGYDQRLQMLERSHTHEPQTPVGAMVDWPGPTVPNLWHPADGTSLPTASYPDLFNVLGYTYGGSGANFNLPDARDRVTVGANTRALAATGGVATVALTAAQTGTHSHNLGVDTSNETSYHTHGVNIASANESQSHTHTGTTDTTGGVHSHTVTGSTAQFAGSPYAVGPGANLNYIANVPTNTAGAHGHPFTTGGDSNTHAHTVTGSTGNDAADHHHALNGTTDAGGTTGAAHENMPPWLALTKIIKILPSTAAAAALTVIERNR